MTLTHDMSASSMERDGFPRFQNAQGSAVSSPVRSPETTAFKSTWYQSTSGSHSGDEKKSTRKPNVCYRECQKNHAASLGGHAVDGCGEFIPSGKEGTLEALKCAACSCHRNFHRREFLGPNGELTCSCGSSVKSQAISVPYMLNQAIRPMSPMARDTKGHQLLSSADISPHAQLVMPLAQFEDENDEEEDDDDDEPPQHPYPRSGSGSKKKRFRTKFTADQKERMREFADTLGWRFSKHDEDNVKEFCNDVGLQRNVFKVWMHNNKHLSRTKM